MENNDKFKWLTNAQHAIYSAVAMYAYGYLNNEDANHCVVYVLLGLVLGSSNDAIAFVRNTMKKGGTDDNEKPNP